nr:lysozyme [Bacteroides pyogenes]
MAAHAQARLPTEKQPSTSASIFELPPFERAVCCIRFYEGMHRAKDYPYVGYGHKLRPGERYSSNMSAQKAEQLLRKDLKELCALFRPYGKDSLLLATLSYNVGPYKVLGNSSIPESRLIKKIKAGSRNFQKEYLDFSRYKGKVVASISRRRWTEFKLLYRL